MQRSQPLSRTLKALLADALMTRPGFWAHAVRRRAMPVLCYHRVTSGIDPLGLAVSPTEFAQQMNMLASSRHLRPVSAAEFGLIWRGEADYGQRVPLLVTFDDGFRDNLTAAAPILQAHRIPAILFVTTDVLDGKAPWYDLVERLLASGRQSELRAALGDVALPSAGDVAAPDAAAWVDTLLALSGERFADAVAAVRGLADAGMCVDRYLSAAELKTWQTLGMEVGAHTCTHPRLSALDEASARWEISESKARLEALLSQRVTHFAYPFGRRGDFSAAHASALGDAGYEMAFTTVQGANRAAGNPFVVRRKCVNAGLFERPGAAVSESLFMADLMGVGADLRRALRHGPRRDDVAFGA